MQQITNNALSYGLNTGENVGTNEDLIRRVIGLLFPPQRKWVVRVFVVAGLSMISAPLWEPFLNAILEKYLQVSAPSPNGTIGGILLALGVLGAIANEMLDRRDKRINIAVEDVADKKTLQLLFSQLHLPTLDQFIYHGKSSMIYVPVLHYFFGLDAVFRSSTYHLHNQQLRERVEYFHTAISKALSYGDYFVGTPNEELQKFDSRRDVHADPEAKAAYDGFIEAVWDTEDHLKALCKTVRSKFPDFDLEATSERALGDYKSYYEEVMAEAVSDWEFTVLAGIIHLEERREMPTLQNLSSVLAKPGVDVRVALDKLIGLGYVQHLYPGALHQKYTALAGGRAYFVRQRDLSAQD